MSRVAAIDALAESRHSDYLPYSSPREQMEDVEVAAYGTIAEVYAGEVDYGPEDVAVLIIDVTVEEAWRGKVESRVSVMTPWAEGSPVSVESMASGLPRGAKIAVFGDRAELRPRSTRAPDATVVEPVTQGLLIQVSGDKFVNVWAEEEQPDGWAGVATFAALREALGIDRQ
ncbi:hypothetical protein [Nocardioides daejeonensis]|uniref:hypothetical protein n=1 Tax=Nocardioides daejeonensis TaxID=1046556 RepID=UPI0013A5AC70|nr:hypothetical protein [Nocardioides daejeonensis]